MSHTSEIPSIKESLRLSKTRPLSVDAFLRLNETISIYIQEDSSTSEDRKKIAQILENLREVTMTLFHEVDDLKKAQDDLKSKVEALEARNRELEIPLLTGQLAYKVERELVIRILKGTGVGSTNVTLHTIRDALQNQASLMGGGIFAGEEQRKKAYTNWTELNELLGLTGHTYSAISELKSTRNATAHPDLPLEKLSSRLRSEVISDSALLEKSEMLIQVLKGLGVSRIKT